MIRINLCVVSFFLVVVTTAMIPSASAAQEFSVMVGPDLEDGFGMGIDDGCRPPKQDWLNSFAAAHEVSYSGGCPWAAVFVTVGAPGSGQFMDLSGYSEVSVDIRGAAGTEFKVGMKEYNRNGAGPTQTIILRSDEWDNYTIRIGNFSNLAEQNVHSVFELIFGRDAVALQFRNITMIR